MDIKIMKATPGDAPAIRRLLDSWLLFNDTGDRSRGFLIADYTEDDLHKFAGTYKYFFKAMDGDRIAGVVIGCESIRVTPDDNKYSLLKYSLNKPFAIIKQVFAAPGYTGRGVCSQLYEHIFSILPADRPVIAIIVKDPPNEASFRFHARHGFSEYLEFTPDPDPDGIAHLRSAWIRPAATSGSHLDDVRLTNI